MDLSAAYKYCKNITLGHYENFPVASVLLPAAVRHHIFPIYAFARHADDLADEHGDRPALLAWREALHDCVANPSEHPIFRALGNTIRECRLPPELFDDLIAAFLQDLDKNRYNDTEELLAYCRYSANPVGRLVLLLHGHRDPALFAYSDHICSALQLTNFWQDVTIDLQMNRLYIPQSAMDRHGVLAADIIAKRFDPRFAAMLADLVETTRSMFAAGLPLLEGLGGRLRYELKLTVLGGLSILGKIEKIDYNVLATRPLLSRTDWLLLIPRLLTQIPVKI